MACGALAQPAADIVERRELEQPFTLFLGQLRKRLIECTPTWEPALARAGPEQP